MSDDNLFFSDEDSKPQEDFLESQNSDHAERVVDEESSGEYIKISKSKLAIIKNIIKKQHDDTGKILEFLDIELPESQDGFEKIGIGQLLDKKSMATTGLAEEGKIIEGVFDGENMIGPDGKRYSVPANYASKSKLVEGDIMKLSILQNGTFIYKQICPAKRRRVAGILKRDGEDGYFVESEGKRWKVLSASVTYFKGDEGDEAVILVPEEGESRWGSLENIVKRYES